MKEAIDLLLVIMILSNMWVLGSSRMVTCIRAVALQGLALGLLPFALYPGDLQWDFVLMGVASVTLKGIAFPWLLRRALTEVHAHQQVEPFVGYGLSLLFGVGSLVASLVLIQRNPLPVAPPSDLLMPVAIATLLVGLFVLVSRRKALTQALGYLMFENGIHCFGLGVLRHAPLMVELGILLDIFFAVFVMGITIFHIRRAFDSLDTMQMAELRG